MNFINVVSGDVYAIENPGFYGKIPVAAADGDQLVANRLNGNDFKGPVDSGDRAVATRSSRDVRLLANGRSDGAGTTNPVSLAAMPQRLQPMSRPRRRVSQQLGRQPDALDLPVTMTQLHFQADRFCHTRGSQ